MTDPRTLKFKPWQRHQLREMRDHDPRPFVRERSAAILKIAEGHSPHWVAQHGLLKPRDPDTVYHWLALFKTEGCAGLRQHPQGGPRRTSPLEAHRTELEERLRQAPAGAAETTASLPHRTPLPPSRWSLIVVRQHFEWLEDYSLSGVWRVLQHWDIAWKRGYVQHWSPDPAYQTKVRRITKCLKQAASDPQHTVALFLDEMGYTRWPTAAPDWLPGEDGYPRAEHGNLSDQQWRVIGALNALTGQVAYAQNYIVGRREVIAFLQRLAQQYAHAGQIYVIADNWNIHTHPDVQAAVAALPRLELVWLPTYASWLNPIEKLWRWVRQRILHRHRLSDLWDVLKQRVARFFDQFAKGSTDLLRYVGLAGDGKWAKVIRKHYRI